MKIKSVSINEVEYTAHRLAVKFMTWDELIPSFSSRFPNILESCLTDNPQMYRIALGVAKSKPKSKDLIINWLEDELKNHLINYPKN